MTWHPMARDIAAGGARLLSLWVDRAAGEGLLRWPHISATARCLVIQAKLPANEESYPGIADLFPCAARMQRAAADLTGVRAQRSGFAAVAAARGVASRVLSARGAGCGSPPDWHADGGSLSVRARLGRRRARDSGRTGARGHHRARAFPLLDRRREGAQARGAARLRAQGHRAAVHEDASCSRAIASRRACRAIPPSRSRGRIARRSRACRALRVPAARAVAAGARARERAHRESSRRPRRARQRCGLRIRPRPVFATEGAVAPRASRPRWGSAICSTSSSRAAVSRDSGHDRLVKLMDCVAHARARGRGHCVRSTTSTPACAIDSPAPARSRPTSPSGSGSSVSPVARAARTSICASICLAIPTASLPCASTRATEGDVAARVAVRFDELFESLRVVSQYREALAAGRSARGPLPCRRRARRHRSRRRLARPGAGRARAPARTDTSRAVIRTTRRGRTGRCSSTQSSATSCRTFR